MSYYGVTYPVLYWSTDEQHSKKILLKIGWTALTLDVPVNEVFDSNASPSIPHLEKLIGVLIANGCLIINFVLECIPIIL